jgi:glycine/D-amino acid oxidase-like deaminating enzyme/nitrite reductase/ring-hydroxylating ferredoxin subunit
MTGTTSSLWELDDAARAASPLDQDTKADVCVVGAGIAGLTTAYLLATEGRSVVLLDANEAVGGGETEYTTAHLAWVLDDRFARVASIRGDDATRAAAESHRGAVALIEQIAQRERIACDFQRVHGHLFPGSDGPDAVEKEIEALRRLGIAFEQLDRPPLGNLAGPCLRFADHGQFHPIKYLAGLAAAYRRARGALHTKTRVQKIQGGDPCAVTTEAGHTVTAKAVVVATNSPFDAGVLLHTRMSAYTTFAVALAVPRGTVPHGLYWDTEDPYHYVRVHPGKGESDYLVVGGEDHKTGQADDQPARWDRLEEWTREKVPAAGAVKHHWSGQVFETHDGLGLIGAAPWGENVFVITGDSGMGMTHGTLGARLVANLIRGTDDPLAPVYSPSRWMPKALLTFLSENANVAAQYRDWFTGGEVKSADDIPPGHGAIVRRGLKKLAVYKEKDGTVCESSAACPHMGAVVRWNPGEETWDCPAHGSRFTCDGKVLHGPAVKGLTPAEEPAPAAK